MAITVDAIIKVTLIILFLLYAYFMIGDYTPRNHPCNKYEAYDNNINMHKRDHNHMQYPTHSTHDVSKSIYQMGPYMNF
jgi:hypothetical protein